MENGRDEDDAAREGNQQGGGGGREGEKKVPVCTSDRYPFHFLSSP